MSRTLVFDLDGTLVDSLPDLMSALNRLMAARGFSPFADAEVARMVGDGAQALLDRAFAARAASSDAAAMAAFLADYTANSAVGSRLYPGVGATLAGLRERGWRLAVCTNKPEVPARHVLAALGVDHFFAAVGGGDSFPVRKPDPLHLIATLEAAGGRIPDALMAGDHANDVAAARGAGIECVFAAWGYGTPAMAAGAAAIAESFDDLAVLADRLLPARAG
jgi:phosphoglycolate phosphatase